MAERRYGFVQVDVFTEVRFGGNPLAVFPEAEGLTDGEMQAIAKEMNLSETTFVLAATEGARAEAAAKGTSVAGRVRIFTPGRELAFAGHPTLGTAYVLSQVGRIPGGAAETALEEGIGLVPVRFEGSFVWMRQRDATFGTEVRDRVGIAGALGLQARDLLEGAAVCEVSTGNSFLFVPVRDRAAVDRAVLGGAALLRAHDDPESHGVFVFSPDGVEEDESGRMVRVYSRMLAPHLGIPEDPATGSASGPLGAYVLEQGLAEAALGADGVRDGAEVRILSEQGTKMGRRSFAYVRLKAEGGKATKIEVGGGVVSVLEGTLTV